MKRFLPIAFLSLVIIISLGLHVPYLRASSQQAYRDYLYQFDVYRQNTTEFKVAKNEYEKFRTLTSQTTALEKTKAFLVQRDLLLRAYLLLLNEKLAETPELPTTERNLYQTLISAEVAFLENHSKLVEPVGSLEDATLVSKQFEQRHPLLHSSIRQTITGIALGNLAVLAKEYDITLADARALVNTNRGVFPPTKQATIDRWVLQITNTRSLAQQKIEMVSTGANRFKSTTIDEQDALLAQLTRYIAEARQYLAEGTSYLNELINAIKYQD